MKTGFLRRTLFAGLVYFCLFVGIVALQFSSPRGANWKSGFAAFHATSSHAKPESVEGVRITLGALLLAIDAEKPAFAVLSNGDELQLRLSGADTSRNGATMTFTDDVTLTLLSSGDSASLAVKSGDPKLVALRLRSQLLAGATLSRGESGSVITSRSDYWNIDLPVKSFGADTLTIPIASPLVLAAIHKAAPVAKTTVVVKSDFDFRQITLSWIDKAWSGLGESRFNPQAITWSMKGGGSAFSEQALLAWLAESFRRGQGEAALSKARLIRGKQAEALSWLSVPYLGDLTTQMSARQADDEKQAARLSALVNSSNPAILEERDLVVRLVDRCPRGFSATALGFIASLAVEDLSLRQQVGLLAAASDAARYLRGFEDALPNHKAAEKTVIAAIVTISGGRFLKPASASIDLRLSLNAGLQLIALGKAEGKDDILASGQALVESALALSTSDGYLPETLVVAGSSIQKREGDIAPESIYPLLADNSYYPHEVSFARDVGPGIWAWTCAPVLTVEAGNNRRVFSASFPVGLSHYLAIYGVPIFQTIKLYGINYSPDSQFESYNVSGYVFKASTGALYLKMRHKAEVEKVELDF